MTKNPNPDFLFFLLSGWGRGERQGRPCLGVGRRVGAIIFICYTLYQPTTHCFTFSLRYFTVLPTYGSHKSSLRNSSKRFNSKNNERKYTRLIEEFSMNISTKVRLQNLQWFGSKWLVWWLVGCFEFNGRLRQYMSLNRAVSQRGRKKREK